MDNTQSGAQGYKIKHTTDLDVPVKNPFKPLYTYLLPNVCYTFSNNIQLSNRKPNMNNYKPSKNASVAGTVHVR